VQVGLLPVKHLGRAKQRLAGHFDARTRIEVARAMLSDALELCRATPFLAWWVVSDDAEVAERARRMGLRTLGDAPDGLNASLAGAMATASAEGAASVTVLPADVPLARPEDVRDLVDTGATSDIVVVPARRGGTNGLHLAPPTVLAPSYGPGSLAAHLEAAAHARLRCSILDRPGLSLDVDTIADVNDLLETEREHRSHTVKLLEALRAASPGATLF
jgi:2-phospho-L-lactate guanylyltransferase